MNPYVAGMRPLLLGTVMVCAAVFLGTPAAQGVGNASRHECADTWQHAQSDQAQQCRATGWTVRPRLTVSPRRVVKHSSMPVCLSATRPGHPDCSWNFNHAHTGPAFWIGIHRIKHYVWTHEPPGGPGEYAFPDKRQQVEWDIPPYAQIIEGVEHVWVRYPDGSHWSS